VGENARPVAKLAEELGMCWWTTMGAVIEHGTPLVESPDVSVRSTNSASMRCRHSLG
jgi:hypothetical protein